MHRVSVVGSSGAGKTTTAKEIAARLELPFVELDAVHHLENWTPIEPEDFVRTLDEITAAPEWVIDGNYRIVVREGPVWERADTIVWLDVSKSLAMWQVTKRTVSRGIIRKELWNGNREDWRNVFRWDPDKSMIRWVWTTHASVRERYESVFADPPRDDVELIRLRTRREIADWLAGLGATAG